MSIYHIVALEEDDRCYGPWAGDGPIKALENFLIIVKRFYLREMQPIFTANRFLDPGEETGRPAEPFTSSVCGLSPDSREYAVEERSECSTCWGEAPRGFIRRVR